MVVCDEIFLARQIFYEVSKNNNNNPGRGGTGGRAISNRAKTTAALRDVSKVGPQLYVVEKNEH